MYTCTLLAACYVIPVEHMEWNDAEAIVAMSAAAIGLLATFLTCHVFIRHNNTPVVKASTRELSYLILAGMTLSHFSVRNARHDPCFFFIYVYVQFYKKRFL